MIFCRYCHFSAEYNHYRIVLKQRIISGYNIKEPNRINDGYFADENKICLPCQCARKFES